jgi:drug/metabolite transporter (DMT)-like permease
LANIKGQVTFMQYYGLVFLAGCLWGAIGVIGRGAFQHGMSPLEVSFWRAAISGGLFVVHAGLTRQLQLRCWYDSIFFILFGLLAVSLFNASYFLAVQSGGVTLATIMLYTAPAFVGVAAHFLFGERLSIQKIILIGLTIAGIGLIALAGDGQLKVASIALAWGLVSGATYALYYLFGKYILPRYQTITVMALAMPIGAVGLAPLVSFGPRPLPAWLAVLGLAVISTYLAYQLYYAGLRHIEASRAVLVASIEPVVASLLAAWLYGEQLSWSGYLGAVLVIGSAVASAWPKVKR